MQAYVYIIGETDGPQKIGITKDLARRLLMLQAGNPAQLKINAHLVVLPHEAANVESFAHFILSKWHIRGEWFDVTPKAAIAALKRALVAVRGGTRASYRARNKGRSSWDRKQMRVQLTDDRRRITAQVGVNQIAEFICAAVRNELKRREAHNGEHDLAAI